MSVDDSWTIFKYPLNNTINHLSLPKNSELLTVQNQFEKPVLWVRHDQGKELETFDVVLVPTGGESPPPNVYTYDTSRSWKYLSTIQFQGGHYILHAFWSQEVQHGGI